MKETKDMAYIAFDITPLQNNAFTVSEPYCPLVIPCSYIAVDLVS